MNDTTMETLQYPIGRFNWSADSGPQDCGLWIQKIAATPEALRAAVIDLNPQQLDTPYREGGWTVRQVVHHYADDHMNSYIRFKWALTEEAPLIKGYAQGSWAELPDGRSGPIEPSLDLLTALHERWVMAWESLTPADWQRTFVHPVRGPVSLATLAALYAWHGAHHVEQVRRLRERSGWPLPGDRKRQADL